MKIRDKTYPQIGMKFIHVGYTIIYTIKEITNGKVIIGWISTKGHELDVDYYLSNVIDLFSNGIWKRI